MRKAERSVSKNTRAKRLRMRKVSIFKLAVANANFTTVKWPIGRFNPTLAPSTSDKYCIDEVVPYDFRHANIITNYKHKGDRSECWKALAGSPCWLPLIRS